MKYTPILKGKFGEGVAIQNLSPRTRDRTFAIIEVPPIPTKYSKEELGVPIGKDRTLIEHLETFVRGIAIRMPGDLEFGIDFSQLVSKDKTPSDPIDYVFSEFWKLGLTPTPVIGLNEGFNWQGQLLTLIKQSQSGAAVRISRSDCYIPSAILRKLGILSQTLGLPFSKMAIIFDYGMITRGDMDDIVNECRAIENELPLSDFRLSSMVATSMPSSVTLDMKAYATDTIPRLEWKMWNRANLIRLGFGDYGVSSPEYFDEDIRQITLGGKVRYTTPNSWLIVKGAKLEKNGKQFHRLAQIIRECKECNNPKYSWGDNRICDCAEFQIGPGTLTTWLAFTTNHHLTLAARQLASSA